MSTQTDKLQQIANAIRASSGETEQIQASLFYQKFYSCGVTAGLIVP